MSPHPALWWTALGDGRVQCRLCPHGCRLSDGQRGLCSGRQNQKGALVATTYGTASGFAVDPVEKKPLYHFHPGTKTLSFGTVGCVLSCRFCQNWRISQTTDQRLLTGSATPGEAVTMAGRAGCSSLSFTYNEPAVFAEFALDTAAEAKKAGLKTIAVSAGYFQPEAAGEFFGRMDAANIDLKGFDDSFYRTYCGGSLAPVLETLQIIRRNTGCWLEITNLIIPGANDSDGEIAALGRWVFRELGPEVPVHFSAFHPDHQLRDRSPTPPATVIRARETALREGLKFVYTGNIWDRAGSITSCPECGAALVLREGFQVTVNRLGIGSACPECGATVPGVWC